MSLGIVDPGSGSKREPVRFLVFSASLRTNSLNTRLVRLAAERIEANDGMVSFALMHDFDAVSYTHLDVYKRQVQEFVATVIEC